MSGQSNPSVTIRTVTRTAILFVSRNSRIARAACGPSSETARNGRAADDLGAQVVHLTGMILVVADDERLDRMAVEQVVLFSQCGPHAHQQRTQVAVVAQQVTQGGATYRRILFGEVDDPAGDHRLLANVDDLELGVELVQRDVTQLFGEDQILGADVVVGDGLDPCWVCPAPAS